MTEKIFEKDGLIFDFEAAVLSCEKEGDLFALVLDRTAFFPGGGGQEFDAGKIDGKDVVSVKTVNDEIVHYVNYEISPGSVVTCSVDKEIRRMRMEHHTGEHILSGTINRLFGFDNVGFHLGDEYVTLDTSGPLTGEMIREVERIANEKVRENIPINVSFHTEEEASTICFRSKKELHGIIRLVEIPGVDVCACCAPHLHSTGEVGLITIINQMPWKGGTRLFVLCGKKAQEEVRRRFDCLKQISDSFSVKPLESFDAVMKLKNDFGDVNYKNYELITKICDQELSNQNGEYAYIYNENLTPKIAGKLGEKWSLGKKFFIGFSGATGEIKYTIISQSVNLKEHANEINEILCGRGGGKQNEMSGQTTLKPDELKAAADRIFEILK